MSPILRDIGGAIIVLALAMALWLFPWEAVIP